MIGLSSLVYILLAFSILPSGLSLPRCHQNWKPHHGRPKGGVVPSPSISYNGTDNFPSTPTVTPTEQPGTSSPSTSPSVTPPIRSASGSNTTSDIQTFLSTHNDFRAKHGAAPLTWDATLASKAQEWASRCVFQHSGGVLGRFGENLAAGTAPNYGIAAAVKSWTDEVTDYNPNNPVPSHFTQVVWKSTTQIGCHLHLCYNSLIGNDPKFGPAKYVVCEYSPPGNVLGSEQFRNNVQ